MLKKFLRDVRDMWEKLPLCQMQATAVIWAVPIWGQHRNFGGKRRNLGGQLPSPLSHDGYGR